MLDFKLDRWRKASGKLLVRSLVDLILMIRSGLSSPNIARDML